MLSILGRSWEISVLVFSPSENNYKNNFIMPNTFLIIFLKYQRIVKEMKVKRLKNYKERKTMRNVNTFPPQTKVSVPSNVISLNKK